MNRMNVILTAWILLTATTALTQVDLTGDFILEKMDRDDRLIEKCQATFYKKKGTSYIRLEEKIGESTGAVLVNDRDNIKIQFVKIDGGRLVSRLFSGRLSTEGLITGQYMVSKDGIPDENVSGHFVMKRMEGQITKRDEIGGHIGIVHGLFTLQSGNISGILDENYQYAVGFPMGITVVGKKVSFDLEFVPSIAFNQEAGQEQEADYDQVTLLVHPGVLYPVRKDLTLGMRLAFELGEAGRFGITPLINFNNILPNSFVEVVLPIRFGSGGDPSITLGLHFGVGF